MTKAISRGFRGIHQERNLTYALFRHAGHLVLKSRPGAAVVFVLSNRTVANSASAGRILVDFMYGETTRYYGDNSDDGPSAWKTERVVGASRVS
ncbi:hypothetical protein B0H13DRAFT_2333337 [Mycena leptocephala]|nr:hypothetical protein B0H13DRAFT_2333337 [Mycena leptocephala]